MNTLKSKKMPVSNSVAERSKKLVSRNEKLNDLKNGLMTQIRKEGESQNSGHSSRMELQEMMNSIEFIVAAGNNSTRRRNIVSTYQEEMDHLQN